MATYTVSTKSELQSALSSAKGGDEILLNNGNYGDFTFTQDYSSMVTVRAAKGQDPTFNTVEFSGASYIRLDDVTVSASSTQGRILSVVNNSHHIEVANSEVSGPDGTYQGYGIYAKEVSNLVLENNYVHNADIGITNFTVTDAVIRGNSIDWINSDSFKFSTMTRALIESNWGARNLPNDVDHQDFMQFEGANMSRDVIIRGNVFLPADGTDSTSQGIFFSEDNLNVTIEENIIVTGLPRGISVSGEGLVIRNNTVLHTPPPEGVYNQAEIVSKQYDVIENNIWTSYSGGFDGTNVIVQWDDGASGTNYVGDLFTDFQGAGTTLEGLIPIEGSVVDGKGAYDTLIALLAGEVPTGARSRPNPPTPKRAIASSEIPATTRWTGPRATTSSPAGAATTSCRAMAVTTRSAAWAAKTSCMAVRATTG